MAALKSVSIRRSTDNDISGHYFHHQLFCPFFSLSQPFLQKHCSNQTQTYKLEYASARDIKLQRGFKKEKCYKVEYAQHRVCLVYLQSSLHENVVFSVCAHMGNAAYIMFIMWNSISGLDAWYNFLFNISCGVAVTVRSHQQKFQFIFKGMGRGQKELLEGRASF